VTSMTPTSGSITGGTPVTMTGTGFLSGATTVNFVEESIGQPASDNNVIPVTPTAVTPTTVTVAAPPVFSGSTYFVTVTTPVGTSAYSPGGPGSNMVFTYLPFPPSVTSFTASSGTIGTGTGCGTSVTTCGPTTGGTALTITGKGFMTGATVTLIPDSPSGGSPILAPNPVVHSDTMMTAVTPAVTAVGTYYMTVTTPGQPESPTTSKAVLTYSLLFPVVWSIAANPAQTTLTITGTSFGAGDTVAFQPESGGSTTGQGAAITAPAANVTVVNPTTLTVSLPLPKPLTAKQSYFVEVTNSTGAGTADQVFTPTH
jgi:hypothetical protein